MKNVQVIDRAANCTFSIFQATEEEFAGLFPGEGQDIQFAEDLPVGSEHVLAELWMRPIRKRDIQGLHGTLFYEFAAHRDLFPSTKREDDWDLSALNAAQRKLFSRATGSSER